MSQTVIVDLLLLSRFTWSTHWYWPIATSGHCSLIAVAHWVPKKALTQFCMMLHQDAALFQPRSRWKRESVEEGKRHQRRGREGPTNWITLSLIGSKEKKLKMETFRRWEEREMGRQIWSEWKEERERDKKMGKSDMRRLALSPLLVSMATGDIPARGRVFLSLSD